MTKPYVKQTIENNISFIEFYHPSHNSLPGDILQQLVDLIKNAGDNEDVKDSGKTFFSGFANVMNAMRTCPKFIIGRVQGKTVGGGVGLAACSDYCMATKYAEIKLSELNIGIGPFVIGPAIERKIGLSALSQISIDASTFYSASWAKQKGLFTQVYDNITELDLAVKDLATQLCSYNLEAMKEMKKMFWRGTDHWDLFLAEQAQISGRLVLSNFTKEKLKKFK